MKKWLSAIFLVVLLCLIPLVMALSETGTVTASSLNMRKSTSSTSDVVKVLRQGTKVTINGTSGSWYKVTVDGKTGYVAKKYISVSSGSSKSSSSSSSSKKSSSSDGTCKSGDTGEAVKKVQKRLKALGYYSGSIDGDYGNGTKSAVKAFQKRNGLKETGEVNSNTLKKLNSSDAKKASSGSSSSSSSGSKSSSSDGTCKKGDTGEAVKKVQKRLKALGYYDSVVDGDYGNGTKNAVKAFQKRNGLKETGEVNSATLKKLNSSDAKKASSSDSGSSGSTEKLNWFNGGSSKIPKGATFQVKDIKTGKVFTVKRWSGYNHIDAEPLTASDTKVMKSIYGHWSWRRRAVLVKYNGHVYAASMNGMPHGTSTISGNNFDGHFCIHFSGSKTHGSGKVDDMHQKCVKEALKHSW